MGLRRLLVADLDGTLLGDDDALRRFAAWHAGRRPSVQLAYATGRARDEIDVLVRETALPRPDVAITQVGTEIHDGVGRPWPSWERRFHGWDAGLARRALALAPHVRLQPPSFQTPRKASFYAEHLQAADLERIRELVDAAGQPAHVIYSGDLYLDVLPAGAGKGEAAREVARALGFSREHVLVFGDTGNDIDLFQQGFLGTIVGNGLPELSDAAPDAYRSPDRYAAGVLDGVRHWWPEGAG